MKTTTLPLKHSTNRSHCPFALLIIPLVLACFPLWPQAQATCQEGCLADQNTVLGDDALLNEAGVNTRLSVFKRCIAPAAAATTRPSAIKRSMATSLASTTPPSV